MKDFKEQEEAVKDKMNEQAKDKRKEENKAFKDVVIDPDLKVEEDLKNKAVNTMEMKDALSTMANFYGVKYNIEACNNDSKVISFSAK